MKKICTRRRQNGCAEPQDPRVEIVEKGELVLEGWRASKRRLLARREAWLSLIEELGWAAAASEVNGRASFNSAARTEWRRAPDLDGQPSIAAIRRHLRRTARDHILIDCQDLVVWRPLQDDRSANAPELLSARESEILSWLREGKTSEEIGVILGLSKRTIEKHQQNLYRKLKVANAAQAILYPAT